MVRISGRRDKPSIFAGAFKFIMKKNRILLVAAALALSNIHLQAAAVPLPIMGDWQGKWVNTTKASGYMMTHPELCAEVIALGGDRYRIRFVPQLFKRAHLFKEIEAAAVDGKIHFDDGSWRGEVAPGALTGEAFYDSKKPVQFSLAKSDFVSPTMGMSPPDGATVLFDGKNLDAWQMSKGEGKATWPILDHSILEVQPHDRNADVGGSIRTKEQFGDVYLHLEFKLAYEPQAEGQGRSNSGVFLQSLYEVQILDSFGMEGTWNECGAIYHTAPPKVNACLPPGEWQTYDILFRAARFNSDDSVAEYPRITVRQNGILVQYNEELPESTFVASSINASLPVPKFAPIELQDHNHLVQYRNIWAAPLPDSAEALIANKKALH